MTSQSVLVRFVFLREASSRRLELFAMYRKRAGRSGISCCVSGADVDGRHDIQHEITRHDRACCAKTPRNMTLLTASIMQVRAIASHIAQHLETDRSSSGTGKTLAQCDTYGAAQLCDRSAKHACSQVCASVGSLRKSHEANNSITEISLFENNIGDGGAIALAESLKATLLTCFLVRAMLSVWPAGP